MLLNSKSIIDCDEYEEEIHNGEIELIADKIYELPNYDCAVVIKYKDIAHKNKKEKIMSCSLHNFLEMVQYVDIKNGVDLEIGDNNLLTIRAYGQCYEIKDDYYNVITDIYIMPFEGKVVFIDISYIFKDMNLKPTDYQLELN